MKTYKQYLKSEVERITREHDCSRGDAAECVSVRDWWKYIQEELDAGANVPPAVCRSIVKNDCSLVWIAKNWPNSIPMYVSIKTGVLS